LGDGGAACRIDRGALRRRGLVAGLVAAPHHRLIRGEEPDLRPSAHWPEPNVVMEPDPEDGPVS
jgi:hypothetical protein